MPPHSGKALWAHQLLKHMEQPMNLIKVHQNLLQTAHGKTLVKKYNKMAITLTEYEILRYRNWIKIVESTCSNLQVCKSGPYRKKNAINSSLGPPIGSKKWRVFPQSSFFYYNNVGGS